MFWLILHSFVSRPASAPFFRFPCFINESILAGPARNGESTQLHALNIFVSVHELAVTIVRERARVVSALAAATFLVQDPLEMAVVGLGGS